MRVLLLATLFKMPYRVLRCAHAANAGVYVLGTERAKALQSSRFCNGFLHSERPIDGSRDEALALEVNRYSRQHGIDMILAGDPPSTRSLIAIRDLLDAPCFPMPNLREFDLLNNKWRFYELCQSLGMRCPPTRVFPDIDSLSRNLGTFEKPLIAKPLSMDGAIGCIKLDPLAPGTGISAISYKPILVQEFIDGTDMCASVFCTAGEIRAFAPYRCRRDTYVTFFHRGILEEIAKLTRNLSVDGVLNFDMRLARDGRIFYIECNPRFFFNIAMSMIAGINFVALGLHGCSARRTLRICEPMTVRFPKGIVTALHTPWKLGKKDWDGLRFSLSDPFPYLLEELHLVPGYPDNVLSAGASPSAPVAMDSRESSAFQVTLNAPRA